jgi:hypothetical protein
VPSAGFIAILLNNERFPVLGCESISAPVVLLHALLKTVRKIGDALLNVSSFATIQSFSLFVPSLTNTVPSVSWKRGTQ